MVAGICIDSALINSNTHEEPEILEKENIVTAS